MSTAVLVYLLIGAAFDVSSRKIEKQDRGLGVTAIILVGWAPILVLLALRALTRR